MANFDDLRGFALALPGAYEDLHFGGPAFRVRNRKFALHWAKGERTILKLPPARQIFLFEVRSAIFGPCRVGTVDWSFVELAPLDRDELRALVVEAWGTVVPKRIARAWSPS